MIDKRNSDEINRVILVGLDYNDKEKTATEETMQELAALVQTAGGEVLAEVMQSKRPDPRTLIGEGKVEEVKELVENLGADLVLFDNELSPSQIRVLTADIGVQVMDRAAIILDIFAQRAKTREGRLQVELAQYQYVLPRLTGMWGHLVRQTAAGGKSPIGTRGPGETQLETDRRHIRRRLSKLKEELREVQRVRGVQRERRQKNEVPVGYTNAGKSTLFNKMTDAGIPANARLFDTLDTTTRRVALSDTLSILLSDTVGFIQKLPHQLVDAFEATLEELRYADLLLHVVDVSNERWQDHVAVVEDLVRELGAEQIPCILVLNKADLCPPFSLVGVREAQFISAKTGDGLPALYARMEEILGKAFHRLTLAIPYDKAGVMEGIHRDGEILSLDYLDSHIAVTLRCDDKLLHQVAPYRVEEG